MRKVALQVLMLYDPAVGPFEEKVGVLNHNGAHSLSLQLFDALLFSVVERLSLL